MTAPILASLREAAGGRRRIGIDAIWRVFAEVHPAEARSSMARELLARELDRLCRSGAAKPPSSARLWDRTGDPPLPAWLELLAGRTGSPPEPRRDSAWAPELAFARTLRNAAHVDALVAVQEFLASGGRDRPMVPDRERSAEVFGDEKRIDQLARTSLFEPGRLTHDLLRCFPVSPPVTWIGAESPSRTGLILENHHTYHSFARWNAERRAYRLVAYGAGKAIWSLLGGFRDLPAEVVLDRIEYFGDLDPTGVAIGARASQLARDAGLPPITAAARWYALLLERGRGRHCPDSGGVRIAAAELDWLPEPVRSEAAALFAGRRRLPQEFVGWEVLAREE